MSLSVAALFALAVIAILFAVAALVERHAASGRAPMRLRHRAYTLALGVYCTSWTVYGAVGSAVRDGWDYLPIYLAPIVMVLVAPRFLDRLARAVRDEQATTVSDFIAARFGHDGAVARLVTVIALAGTVPYMALQFRSIGMALTIVTGQPVTGPAMVAAAVLLAAFALLFGARRFELAGRSEGLVYAIGLESLIKIGALLLVGTTAAVMLLHAPAGQLEDGIAALGRGFGSDRLSAQTLVIGVISVMAVVALPRQFYMGLVEAREPGDLRRARFGLAGYLLIMALLVLPIALAGTTLLGGHSLPDFYVLSLPQSAGRSVVTGAALAAGISAAAAMVITDATALATMVSNDLVFPALMRGRAGEAGALGRRMLLVRRASIVAVVALALVWALLVSPRQSLASIGLVAFAAMAQFTPHLMLASWRRGNDALAARASLSAGLGLWLYTLALPPILPPSWRDALAGSLLDPLRLGGIGHANPLVHGVTWSLGANLLVFAVLALRQVRGPSLPSLVRVGRQVSDLPDLVDLTASFIGRERADAAFPDTRRGMAIDGAAAQRARALIGAVVGTSAARALVASALAGGQMSIAEVTRLLDERGASLGFSRALLAATFENIDAGISVVDADLNLVAWNARYEDLFDYPPGLLQVGMPVAALIRHNARRGDFGPGDTERHVAKRLDHLRRGLAHSFERRRRDGRVIKTVGGPMPGGGYVMSFTDITGEARARAELQATLAELESRVAERTRALSEANHQLASATRDKTRFLAAASHDLLQPLHAARLFTGALARDVPEAARALVSRVDSAILAAENLLRALLDISRLDAGGVQPQPEPLALAPLLADIAEGMRPLAAKRGLRLRIGAGNGWARTDPGLLRSLLQNFIANALHYTERGGVLVGIRRRGDALRIDVIDTGVGIAPDQVTAIFGEFTRLGAVEAEGMGLGLALAERIARLLDARIEVASVPGQGSRFSLWLAAIPPGAPPPQAPPTAIGTTSALDVLVVDDDATTVAATLALLTSLGHRAVGAADWAQAVARSHGVDAVLADYRLEREVAPGRDGLSLIAAIRNQRPGLPAALITAETGPAIRERARALQVPLHAKPASPAAIEAFLEGIAASMREIEPQ